MRDKCKRILTVVPRDVLIIAILICASLASFGLGYLAGIDSAQNASRALVEGSPTSTGQSGEVVASKTGTKYYSLDCPGVSRISEDNKVWFASADLARAQGYEPAANCDGL